MVKQIAVLALLAVIGLPAESSNQLVGAWKLVSYTDTSQTGKPYFPFGTHPIGQFIYTSDGHFSAGIRCDPNGSVPAALPVPEFDDLTEPYIGYFGNYTFDAANNVVTWDVLGASAPSYVDSDISRNVRFDGNRLIVTGSSIRKNGHRWTWERVFVKE